MTDRSMFNELIDRHGYQGAYEKLEKQHPPDYETFLKYVQAGIDAAVAALEKNAKYYLGLLEDQLTNILVDNLVAQEFDAAHDMDYSGHIDISIRSTCKKFCWGAEAKIDYSNDWLRSGVRQLEDSYLDGTTNRDNAGLVIYMKRQDCAGRLSKWDTIYGSGKKGKDSNFSTTNCHSRPGYSFVTTQTLQRSGKPYTLRHIAVSLWRKHSIELLVDNKIKVEQKLADALSKELEEKEIAERKTQGLTPKTK